MKSFEFFSPTTVAEALKLLSDYKEDVAIVAGGTDIVLELNERKINPKTIVDIKKLEELNYIKIEGDFVRIGALTSHAAIAENEFIKKKAKVLHAACASVGSPQIRNLGTIGGNLANASVAADGLAALVTLDAQVILESVGGKRSMSIMDFLNGEGFDKRNALAADELLTEVSFKLGADKRFATAFYKLAKRKSLAISVISGAMKVEVDEAGNVIDIAMRGGALGRYPLEFKEAQDHIRGKHLTRSLMDETLQIMHDTVFELNKSRPWSVYYKKESVKGVFAKLFDDISAQLSLD